jgi:hypothetical protein
MPFPIKFHCVSITEDQVDCEDDWSVCERVENRGCKDEGHSQTTELSNHKRTLVL